MHRFFVRPDEIKGDTCILTGDDAHHIQNVLRLKAGEEIALCNSRGTDFRAVIREMSKEWVRVELLSSSPSGTEPNLKVTLLQGLPKASKMETIIQKCVELGVHDIIPIVTTRTVVKISDGRGGEKKAFRWQRVAEEAAKQSRRGIIPLVHVPIPLETAVETCEADLKIILWEEEKKQSLRMLLQSRSVKPDSIAILIGPEGGLEEKEINLARLHGWVSASLGSRILRTETAGMAVLAAVMYQMEEME
ncbi:MAG TPA: 16S rRNA (uracil(1498)-N(3))-methyltransferase [Clostridiales bacterium]|jgi:16S rRNA (uracil1498-N3)-methyltransferase|nr:16S rRNA (uracil(1498)-N(3))-methyltransferase [Clostridiales bacterium]